MLEDYKTLPTKVHNDPEFKKAFWTWFDELPRKEREKFYHLPYDTAELKFYNLYYSPVG